MKTRSPHEPSTKRKRSVHEPCPMCQGRTLIQSGTVVQIHEPWCTWIAECYEPDALEVMFNG